MKKIRVWWVAALAALFSFVSGGGKANICHAAGDDNHYYYLEACDGEVVKMEYSDHTEYVYPDRSFDDVANKTYVTADDMDYLIDHYVALHPDSVLSGEGISFIRASNATGLDPIFLLSVVGIESGWGTNKTHLNCNNLYSIGMYSDGTHHGSDFSDGCESIGDGIVEGAKFIYENYYKASQTTVYAMNHTSGHSYCDGDESWDVQITSEMDYLRELLSKR